MSETGARPLRAVVADDDPGTRALVAALLAGQGLQVEAVADGEAALRAARRDPPDLVVSDVSMPGLGGLELCRALRADPALRAIPVILHSGSDDEAAVLQGLEAGADDFAPKSVDGAVLLARVRAQLRRAALRRELLHDEHRRALLECAAALGHEVNNPLTALLAHLELLGEALERSDLPRAAFHLEQTARLAARIGGVAHRLVTMASPQVRTYLGSQGMLDLRSAEEVARAG